MTQRVVNYTYGTGNPVLPDGSIDVRDGIDNLQSMDVLMNAPEDTYNQRDGEIVRTVSGMNNEFDTMIGGMNNEFDAQILNMGFTSVGTFAAGATLTNPRQTLLWDIADGGDGQEYGWSGAFPKVVPATSTPASTGGILVGAWISRFDPELRIQVREALRRSYAKAGYNLVDGSFEAGGTLVNANDVLLQESTGKAFSGPAGTVAAGTDPASGGFSDRSGLLPGAGVVRNGRFALRDHPSVKDYGARGDGSTNDTAALTASAARVSSTSEMYFPLGSYKTTTGLDFTGYYTVQGVGEMSQLKLGAPNITGVKYISHSGVFDDHPHNFLDRMRITGDGTFQPFPSPQNGTTVGASFATVDNIGSFGSATGTTFELHAIGRHVKRSYSHHGQYNYYRGNKVGLKLELVTSFTEICSYFRYNSDAAVDILGGQNIKFSGGAIEGNQGAGLRFRNVPGYPYGNLQLDDVYFEVNGNEAAGIPSVDIPYGSTTAVTINGGNYWTNVANGITSGPFMFGDNVSITGAQLNAKFYAKNASIRNSRGLSVGVWNTHPTETLSRLYGLVEPVMFHEFKPAMEETAFTSSATAGLVFQTKTIGRVVAPEIPGVTNIINTTYPYGYVASSGATSVQDPTYGYGDGDFFKVNFEASVGSFSSNYATIGTFTDTTKPFRLIGTMLYAYNDCEIGVLQSVGGQSVTGYFSLKAGKYYRMAFVSLTPLTAQTYMRVFPLNAEAPSIGFLPMWQSQHAKYTDLLSVCGKYVDGTI